jgi:hypothetical protein
MVVAGTWGEEEGGVAEKTKNKSESYTSTRHEAAHDTPDAEEGTEKLRSSLTH